MSLARRPSFSFVQGKLCITTAAHTILLDTWPEVKAVWKKAGGREWKGLVPIFRLLRPKEDWLHTQAISI